MRDVIRVRGLTMGNGSALPPLDFHTWYKYSDRGLIVLIFGLFSLHPLPENFSADALGLDMSASLLPSVIRCAVQFPISIPYLFFATYFADSSRFFGKSNFPPSIF